MRPRILLPSPSRLAGEFIAGRARTSDLTIVIRQADGPDHALLA